MENFVGWLKFYFLGFFSNELSQEGASRSFWNVLLSFLIAFIMVCGGLVAGYVASFGVHYKNADDFRTFLYTAFADESSASRINLSLSGGKLLAEIPDGKQSVNSLIEENGEYVVNGYKLVLDTRAADSTFDDFKLTCKSSDGTLITYEEYKALPEADKNNASVSITYSGKAVDTALKQDEYSAYLDGATDVSEAYEALKQKVGELDDKTYADEIYKLYIKSYYPILTGKDSYGDAPTLRTYYMNSNMYASEDKYLILLDDVCICTFKTTKGIAVDYAGNFNKTDDTVITADGLTSNEMQANMDKFIKDTFSSGNGLNFLVYVVSIFKLLPLFAVIMVFVSLVCFLVYKVKHLEFYGKFIGMFKVTGSFIFISSVLAFITALICSFFLSRGTVYIISGVTLVAVMTIRLAVLVIMEMVKTKKSTETE
ncbi:MAG: hypothetical protein HDP34_03890 [Clostridia bacterium]|nr:hypothetical protein [Clostridia bacterium]